MACAAAFCLGGIALNRGEHINSIWLVLAAACTYADRLTASTRKFIAARVMALERQARHAGRAPAQRPRLRADQQVDRLRPSLRRDRRARAAGRAVLAAQFGYLPGTLWIIIGAVLGGAVQDFVILFASMRRDGKSLGQMAREEIGKVGGFIALVTVLLIMIILLAVVGAGGGERAEGQPVGHVHDRGDDADRAVHGAVPALLAAGQGAGGSAIGFVLVMAASSAGSAVARIGRRWRRCSR